MLKKTSTALKKCIVFFVDFSSIFRRKLMKNRVQSIKNSLARKNNQNQRLERPFLAKYQFLVDLWGPSGSPGGSRDVPGAIRFFIGLRLGVKTWPLEAPEVIRLPF